MSSLSARIQDVVGRAVTRPLFWIIFLAIPASYPIVHAFRTRLPDAPPVLFQLPEYELTDHTGEKFGSKNLKGRVYVADFIFTRCKTRCPQLSEAMEKLQRRVRAMGDAVALVSISVDPEYDTVEKLAEYAKKYHANPRRWRFVTGPLDQVKDAIINGFKMPMDPGQPPPTEQPSLFEITHGTRFVLVDQKGQVRGLYETDEDSVNEMLQVMSLLANLGDQPPPPSS